MTTYNEQYLQYFHNIDYQKQYGSGFYGRNESFWNFGWR